MNKLENLKRTIESFKNPRKLFGINPGEALKSLLIQCHPDRFQDEKERALAESLSKQISGLYEQISKPAEFIGAYEVCSQLDSGDSSDIFLAEKDKNYFVVKKGKSTAVTPFLKNEFKVVKKIKEKTAGTTYNKLFSNPVENIQANEVHFTMWEEEGGYFPLLNLKSKIGGIPGRHIGWLGNRLFSAVATAHSCGYVCGAITPEHILVSPSEHGIKLLGFLHSIDIGAKLKVIPTVRKHWYPVLPNKIGTSLDIYLLCKTLLEVSIDRPKRIDAYLNGLSLEARSSIKTGQPMVTWAAYDEWKEVLLKVFGKPKWVELKV